MVKLNCIGRYRNYRFILISMAAFAFGEANAHDPQEKIAATKIFSQFKQPTQELSRPIGSYARGCIGGAKALPLKGETWQVMHPHRNRNWGHPKTVEFVKQLSVEAKKIGWPGLLIGDLSQPRGGPMPYGHKSHQIGLDVDIWLTKPNKMNLTLTELKAIKPVSVRTKDLRKTNANWTKAHMALLKAAASNSIVDRVFITAPAKIWMCQNADEERDWLQKVRPIRGHNKHFHVRLKCPTEATDCIPQKPTVMEISQSKDGCDHTLDWWVTTALEPYKKPKKPVVKKSKKKGVLSFLVEDLPKECTSIVHIK